MPRNSLFVLAVVAASSFAAWPARAETIDLTTEGALVTASDGTIWNELQEAPTGTGIFEPFLRLQAKGVEEGFNTDFGGPVDPVGSHQPPLDDVSGIWTRSITLGELAAVTDGDLSYYNLALDINEPNGGGQNLLSLDELRLYTVAGDGMIDTLANLESAGTLRYDLDSGTDRVVYMDYDLANGSGQSDVEVLIPVSYFSGVAGTDYLYLYSKFGATGDVGDVNYGSQGGFEEWRALQGGAPPIPEPASITLALLGLGGVGLGALRRRRSGGQPSA
jgi:MYXO-CTERM domain-containing protein